MNRSLRILLSTVAVAGATTAIASCGSEGIQLASSDPNYKGAEIFANHCSGCHTLSVAGTQGSAYNVRTREYKDGPNFDQRKVTTNCALYAIRNGGFSSGPMPQNIVTGADAQMLARFLDQVSGSDVHLAPGATTPPDCPPAG